MEGEGEEDKGREDDELSREEKKEGGAEWDRRMEGGRGNEECRREGEDGSTPLEVSIKLYSS